MIYEQKEHHFGSIYCIDWCRLSRLVATGSNDKWIKILVTPDFDNPDQDQEDWQNEAAIMELEGSKAVVRTVCFHPNDPSILLSGGMNDSDVKVWNTETGQNIANLKGHSGDIYSIKASYDGSFAVSVGKDKMIKIWDIRSKKYVD